MINDVLKWLGANAGGGQEVNWSVAITGQSSMIISKVGGVTSGTARMPELATYIKERPWHSALSGIYLAQRFCSGPSNHAEMCILAAADALQEDIELIGCASDNCEACAVMLKDSFVPSMNSAGGSQMGWSHPRLPIALGTQLGTPWDKQIEELAAVNSEGEERELQYIQRQGSRPSGRYEQL